METKELVKEEFNTLRDEIKATRARLFWLVGMGLFGIPILTYFASDADKPVMLLVPFSALVLIVGYLTEQNNMMRAARYIRERIESDGKHSLGWEAWLESRPGQRVMERHFVACMIVILFVYYFLTVSIALRKFVADTTGDPSNVSWYWLVGMTVIYLIGAIWALSTLVHHWKASVSTSAGPD